MSDAPFFIVGASRSGTTLLRLMLNAHSRLGVSDELKYFNTIAPHADLSAWRAPGLDAAAFARLVDGWLHRRREVFRGMDLDGLRHTILTGEWTLRAPYAAAAAAWARHHGKARWGEKTPRNLFYADLLTDMFPAARFLYVARDPRAVVASMNRAPYFSNDAVLNALNVRRAAGEGYALLCTSVPAERRCAVRYEDLVAEPEATVQAVCAFLGEAYEPAMLDFHRTSARYLAHEIQTPAVARPVDAAHAGAWTHRLRPAEIAAVEAICADALDAWGYVPTGTALPASARLDRAAKQAYWSWKGWQHRDERGYAVHYAPLAGLRRNALTPSDLS